jgi:hypothetical protein
LLPGFTRALVDQLLAFEKPKILAFVTLWVANL